MGLCAFVWEQPYYKVGLLDSTKVQDPSGKYFLCPHTPVLLIDQNVVASSNPAGTQVTGSELAALRLTTEIGAFLKWPLSGFDLAIDQLPSSATAGWLPGAFPLKMVDINGRIVNDWTKQDWVNSVVQLMGGHLTSGVPRDSQNAVETNHWKCTGTSAPTSKDWNMIRELPRLLSDVVEYHTTVPFQTTIKLTSRPGHGGTEIDIKTTSASDVEMWVVNEPPPLCHTGYENARPWELQHVRAFYQLYGVDTSSSSHLPVPIADPGSYKPLTGDPIFCPPADVQPGP